MKFPAFNRPRHWWWRFRAFVRHLGGKPTAFIVVSGRRSWVFRWVTKIDSATGVMTVDRPFPPHSIGDQYVIEGPGHALLPLTRE